MLGRITYINLAALKAKSEIKNVLPPGSGPESAPNPLSPKEHASTDPPLGSVGGGRAKNKIEKKTFEEQFGI